MNGNQQVFIIFNETTGTGTVDDQPPTVTGTPDRAPDSDGWYNAPVTITWTSTDPAPSSGTPTTSPPVAVSADGANQTVIPAQSCDPADNCATGTVAGINLYATPPSVSVTGVTNGSTYSTSPSPACTTTDALSGVAAKATVAVTSSGSSYTATCSGATDNAGNLATPVSVTCQVLPSRPDVHHHDHRHPRGQLTVTSGNTCLVNTTESGQITASPGAALSVTHSTISGTVTATGAASITYCGSTENGTLKITGTTGAVLLGGTNPDGTACAADTIPSLVTITGTSGQSPSPAWARPAP